MRYPLRFLAVAVIIAVVTAACSDSDSSTDDEGTVPGPALGVGPGISVQEALDSTLDQLLLVNGFLVADETGEVRLCEALAESFPPQCGGAFLTVEGLDLASIPDLNREAGVIWSDGTIQLLGEVDGGVLTVAVKASA